MNKKILFYVTVYIFIFMTLCAGGFQSKLLTTKNTTPSLLPVQLFQSAVAFWWNFQFLSLTFFKVALPIFVIGICSVSYCGKAYYFVSPEYSRTEELMSPSFWPYIVVSISEHIWHVWWNIIAVKICPASNIGFSLKFNSSWDDVYLAYCVSYLLT